VSPEDMQRFEIEGSGSEVWSSVTIWHRDCPSGWLTTIDTLEEPTTLAELVQRAGEHTEVCR
jgi:hypothetical protein